MSLKSIRAVTSPGIILTKVDKVLLFRRTQKGREAVVSSFFHHLMGLTTITSSENLAEEHAHLVIGLCSGKSDSAVKCGPSGAELITLNNASSAWEACFLFSLVGSYSRLAVLTRKII